MITNLAIINVYGSRCFVLVFFGPVFAFIEILYIVLLFWSKIVFFFYFIADALYNKSKRPLLLCKSTHYDRACVLTTFLFQWGKEKTWFIPGSSVSRLLKYPWSAPAGRVQTTRFTVSMYFSHPIQMKETQVCIVFISGSTKNTRSTRRSTTALLRPRSRSLSWCHALRHSYG